MQKVIFVKNYKGFKEGDIVIVGNNEAHSLIDGEYAELYIDKMMRTRKGKKWL